MNSIQGKGKKYDLAVCLGKAGVQGDTICGDNKPGYGDSQAILRPQDRAAIGGYYTVRIYNEFDFSRMTEAQQVAGLIEIVKFYLFDVIEVVEGEGEGDDEGFMAKSKRAISYAGGRSINLPAFIAGSNPKPFWMDLRVRCDPDLAPYDEYPESRSAIKKGCVIRSSGGAH
jgi:hypothetical protein